MFAGLLDESRVMTPEQVAKDLARYHYFRKQDGTGHDAAILAALGRRNYSSESIDLQGPDRMTRQLIGAVMECLKDGREIHNAMMCGLTACAAKLE